MADKKEKSFGKGLLKKLWDLLPKQSEQPQLQPVPVPVYNRNRNRFPGR